MKVISVCGITQSGKTTTIEKIIEGLCDQGFRVGSVKEVPFENLDTSANNTIRRHRASGAGLVTVRGPNATEALFPAKLSIEQILRHYGNDYDYVVLEGVEDLDVPTVITAHTNEDLAAKWSDKAICVSGRLSSKIDSYQGKPAYNALSQPKELVDLVLQATEEMDFDKDKLFVNGNPTPLSADAARRIREAVLAELPGAPANCSIELEL